VPSARDRVTEGVQPPFRIERRTVGGGEDDAGGADGGTDRSRRNNSHAGRSGCLIACTGDDGSADFQSGCLGALLRDVPANVGRFVKLRQEALVKLGRAEHFCRPSTVRDVEHQGTGGVGHIDGAVAGETEANVVFWKHDRADTMPVVRLVLANPKEFREGEIRKRRVAGELDDAGGSQLLIDFLTLWFGADVAPDERRANDGILVVEHDSAVHLAGESHARDVGATQSRLRERFSDGEAAGTPPVLRILFGPTDLWRRERRMFLSGGAHHMSEFIDDECASAAGSDVNSEKMNVSLPSF